MERKEITPMEVANEIFSVIEGDSYGEPSRYDVTEIEIGDYIAIHDTGAHGFAMGYNYNGKLKSAELLLKEDGSVEMIRRAETPKDYFANFDCFPIFDKMDWNA